MRISYNFYLSIQEISDSKVKNARAALSYSETLLRTRTREVAEPLNLRERD